MTRAPDAPVLPDHGGECITGIVPALMGTGRLPLPGPAEGARARILLVLDGLGWDILQERAPAAPVLAGMQGRAVTTVLPSTTASGLTSLTTGVAPLVHGVLGLRMRVGDGVLNVLRWRLDGDRAPPDPSEIQPLEPFGGVAVPVVTKGIFRGSGFTGAHLATGSFRGWSTTAVLIERCVEAVEEGATFVYAYYDGVDEVAHMEGMDSAAFDRELRAADRLVGDLLGAVGPDVAVAVTADHGQVPIERWIPLDPLDPFLDAVAGDGRLTALHAVPGRVDALLQAARDLEADAWVVTREEAIDTRWFGSGPPDARVAQRLADVYLAARSTVGFVPPHSPPSPLRSNHGSATRREMLVPFIAARGMA